jgi:nitroreductase
MEKIKPASGKLRKLKSFFIALAKKHQRKPLTDEELNRMLDAYNRSPTDKNFMEEVENILRCN